MYIAGLLNSGKLFQAFATLEDQLIGDFLFRATSAIIHINRISQLHNAILAEYRHFSDELTIIRKRIVFASPNVVALVNEIPPLFNVMRIMQDMVLGIVARSIKIRRSLPNSLSDCMKKISTYGIPETIVDPTRKYWMDHGNLLKDYRDLDQHYFTIINHTLLEVSPELKLLVLLPDNPKARKQVDLSFQKGINALEYLPRSFIAFNHWAETLAQATGAVPKTINNFIRMDQLEELMPAVGGTIALIVEHDPGMLKSKLAGIEISQLDDGRLSFRQMLKEKNSSIK